MKSSAEIVSDIRKAYNLVKNELGGEMALTYDSKVEFESEKGKRILGSAIVHLYEKPDFFPFHVQQNEEILFHHLGGPHRLCLIYPDGAYKEIEIGPDPSKGQLSQFTIEKGVLQAHYPTEDFSFISAVCCPGWHPDDSKDFSCEELSKLFPQHAELAKKLTKR